LTFEKTYESGVLGDNARGCELQIDGPDTEYVRSPIPARDR